MTVITKCGHTDFSENSAIETCTAQRSITFNYEVTPSECSGVNDHIINNMLVYKKCAVEDNDAASNCLCYRNHRVYFGETAPTVRTVHLYPAVNVTEQYYGWIDCKAETFGQSAASSSNTRYCYCEYDKGFNQIVEYDDTSGDLVYSLNDLIH